jgi:hypothetical protein
MMPLRTESASEKKTKVVENFLCFPTVAYTPKPDKVIAMGRQHTGIEFQQG